MPHININEWIELLGKFYDQYGYLVVFLGAMSENTFLLGLLLPGGTLALLGAFYARTGTLNLGWVIFFAWIGTVLGYHIDYLIGRFVLERVITRLSTSRFGRRFRLAGRLRLARALLSKYGGRAIFISHLIGHIRSFVALSAGATRMKYRRFLIFELLAALIWNIGYSLLGYFIGAEREQLQLLIERSGWVVFGVLVLLYLTWRFLKPRIAQRLLASRRRSKQDLYT
jgi:membrane protein DedA with SNARE-associated domain